MTKLRLFLNFTLTNTTLEKETNLKIQNENGEMHILEIINSKVSSGTQPFRLWGGPPDKTEVDFSYFEESSKIL